MTLICHPELYWLLKQRILFFFQWLAHLNNKNNMCVTVTISPSARYIKSAGVQFDKIPIFCWKWITSVHFNFNPNEEKDSNFRVYSQVAARISGARLSLGVSRFASVLENCSASIYFGQ